jgi:DNA (cytosine-5)-methyltransferase 1
MSVSSFDGEQKMTTLQPVFRVIDLFAGAGGFSLAAKLCGSEIVFAVENDPHAVSTYRKNFGSLSQGKSNVLYDVGIQSLSAEDLAKTHFSSDETCDLLLGGPPCQGYSSHRINDAGVDDPRNELIHSYFEFVQKIKPRMFLMENVPGILWKRHEAYLQSFYKSGVEAGYKMFDPITIDARDYGIPQARKRVFVLGIASGAFSGHMLWPPSPTHGSEKIRFSNSALKKWVNCASVFEEAPSGDLNNVHMNHGSELTEAFKNTPINGGSRLQSGRVLPCHVSHKGHKDVYGRIDPRKPAPTMTAGCSNPSKGRFVHPTLHHGITMRQAARIQTFPDSFTFVGGLSAAGRQIGNAVPVRLGEILIRHLQKNIAVVRKIGASFDSKS